MYIIDLNSCLAIETLLSSKKTLPDLTQVILNNLVCAIAGELNILVNIKIEDARIKFVTFTNFLLCFCTISKLSYDSAHHG